MNTNPFKSSGLSKVDISLMAESMAFSSEYPDRRWVIDNIPESWSTERYYQFIINEFREYLNSPIELSKDYEIRIKKILSWKLEDCGEVNYW